MITKTAKALTSRDTATLMRIERAGGYVMRDSTGETLQAGNSRPLAPGRFARLVELKALEPAGDALFDDVPSQTYRLRNADVSAGGWTDDRVATLERLWADGLSASQIAARIGGGISRNAVIGKVHRLGLPGRATRPRPVKRPRREDRGPMGGTSWPVPVELPPVTAFVAARPVIEVAEVPAALRVNLLDVHAGQCRWPLGDPKAPDFAVCGCPAQPGSSFCSHHHRRAHK